MGWTSWFKDDNGDSVKEKVEAKSGGGTTEHTLRDTGGTKADHQHIVVEKDPTGKIERAHAVPNKSKR